MLDSVISRMLAWKPHSPNALSQTMIMSKICRAPLLCLVLLLVVLVLVLVLLLLLLLLVNTNAECRVADADRVQDLPDARSAIAL